MYQFIHQCRKRVSNGHGGRFFTVTSFIFLFAFLLVPASANSQWRKLFNSYGFWDETPEVYFLTNVGQPLTGFYMGQRFIVSPVDSNCLYKTIDGGYTWTIVP